VQFDPGTQLLLFLVGVIAGAVDAVAGGGGIITVPVLLTLGYPPAVALGTNKLQATFGSVTAAFHYTHAGWVDLRACRLGVVATLVGALLGTWSVQRLSSAFLNLAIPWLLVAIFVYTLLRPKMGDSDAHARISPRIFFPIFGMVLGFYDGFFGPGTGSFWTIGMLALLGFSFLRATGTAKVMNATSNAASLSLFAANGSVDYTSGLVMGLGQLIGARFGATLAMTRGARFVRPVFLIMVVLVLARLLWVRFA
jgi:uncharacterized membrane protein YfcA